MEAILMIRPYFAGIMAFPFAQIGLGLRALSLSGWAGNTAALVIYILLSLFPGAGFLALTKKQGRKWEDLLLLVLIPLLFGVLYLMVNPSIMASHFGGAAGLAMDQTFSAAICGGTVWSVLAGWGILKLLSRFRRGSTAGLLRGLQVVLSLLCILFVWQVFGGCVEEYTAALEALRESNTDGGNFITHLYLLLQLLVNVLPWLLDVAVLRKAMDLLEAWREEPWSEEVLSRAHALSSLSAKVLSAVTVASVAFNLLQLLFAPKLRVVNTSVSFPLLSFGLVLVVLLMARLVEGGKELKDDNDLFI